MVLREILTLPLRVLPAAGLICMTVLNPLVLQATNTKEKIPKRLAKAAAIFCWPLLCLKTLNLSIRVVKPDLARSLRVWRYILPIFSAYMWTKWSTDIAARLFHWDRDKVEERWAKRHEKGGQEVYDMVTQVKGYYVKSGQVLATKREFVPAPWCDRLARLWDSTSPRPWRNVRASILRDIESTELSEQFNKHLHPDTHDKNTNKHPKKGRRDKDTQDINTQDEVTALTDATAQLPATPRGGAGGAGSWLGGGGVGGSSSALPVGNNNTKLTLPMSPGGMSRGTRSVAGESVSGFSMRSWAPGTSSVGWLLSGWGRGWGAPATAPTTAPASGGLFTISPTALTVLAEREATRPAVRSRRRGWFSRLGGGGRDGGRDGGIGVTEEDTSITARAGTQGQAQAKGGNKKKKRVKKDKLSQWFEFIDEEPLASASIAQVHAARLSPELIEFLGDTWSEGPEVVVKVQHSDVQRLMGADLRNMGRIARFLGPYLPFDVKPAVEEMQTVIPKEFDFEREARLMAAIKARLSRTTKSIVIPEPIIGLCGPGMIVMQRMQGTPLTSMLSAATKGDKNAREMAKRCLTPVLEAYGQMMLVDGLFHADPHPGNMLLQTDGRVVLLDFGQCKALTAAERRCLCGLYASLAAGDTRGALKAMAPFGLVFTPGKTTANTTTTATANTTTNTSTNNAAGPSGGNTSTSGVGASSSVGIDTTGLDLQAANRMLHVLFDIKQMDELKYNFKGTDVVEGVNMASFPGSLYLVARAIIILRGITSALQVDVSLVQGWRRFALAGLREKTAIAEARAAENMALDKGIFVPGL